MPRIHISTPPITTKKKQTIQRHFNARRNLAVFKTLKLEMKTDNRQVNMPTINVSTPPITTKKNPTLEKHFKARQNLAVCKKLRMEINNQENRNETNQVKFANVVKFKKSNTNTITEYNPTDDFPLRMNMSKKDITCLLIPSKKYNGRICVYEHTRLMQLSEILLSQYNFKLDTNACFSTIEDIVNMMHIVKLRHITFEEDENKIFSGIHMEIGSYIGATLKNHFGEYSNCEFADIVSCLLAHDIGVILLREQVCQDIYVKNQCKYHHLINHNQCYILKNMLFKEYEKMKGTLLSFIVKRIHEKRRSTRKVQRPFSISFCTFSEFACKQHLMDCSTKCNKNMLIAEAIYNHMGRKHDP
jgi:hypothetical protein